MPMRPRAAVSKTAVASAAVSAVASVATSVCAAAALYVVVTTPPHKPVASPAPQGDRWETECGASFVDDVWNGYARSLLRAHRLRERDTCVWEVREQAARQGERAALRALRAELERRYPSGAVAAKTMPLTSSDVRAVEQFWASDDNLAAAQMMQDAGLGRAYPDPEGPHEHWQRQVVLWDMMQDLGTVLGARERARRDADATVCHVRPEQRGDIERVFDAAILRLFEAGDPCARMYIGFGNSEVERLFRDAVSERQGWWEAGAA
jgi:hypothetical protein